MEQVAAENLLGAWSLVTWDIQYDDKRPVTYPYGADAQGLLIYSADGFMSVVISSARRPRLSTESVRKAPVEQKIDAFETYFSYAGRWELHADSVVHRLLFALNPNFIGTDQVRQLDLAGGRLTLSTTDEVKGVGRLHRLVWRREGPAPDRHR